MKLHTERSEVERSNVGVETAFNIKTTAKAFDILSSGLYTDPVLAVVRELSCNAYDAHTESQCADQPFEIHLPNNMEPWFHVKDWGTGLSDEQIQGELVPVLEEDDAGEMIAVVDEDGEQVMKRVGGLYTTYFDSTKTDSNAYIGALGLGSKSPFSYTNAFSVVARFEGKRRMYSVFINEDGVPTIAKMGEVDTDESNGLEVKLAIKPQDFNEFRLKTAKALKWFPIKPNVIGVPHFKFESVPDDRIKGTGWRFLPRSYGDAHMTAIQGNVAYKVNLSHIELDSELRTLLDHGHLVCFFEIGDLEVAASREEIRYDERSKVALLDRIAFFQKEIVGEIEKQAKGLSKSFWQATLELNDISHKMFGSDGGLRSFISKGDGTKNKVLNRYCDQNGRLIIPKTHAWDLIIYRFGGRYSTGKNLSRTHVGQALAPKSDITVFINDVKVGGVGRLGNFIRTTKGGSALTIRRVKDANHMVEDKEGNFLPHYMNEREYQAEYKKLIEALGDPDVKLVSSGTEKVKRMANGDTKLPVFTYNGIRTSSYHSSSNNEKVDWKRVDPDEFDIDEGGLYFPLRNGSRIMTVANGAVTEVNWNARHIEENFRMMITMINKHCGLDDDYTTDDVYAVGATALKKIQKRDNWHNIFDLTRKVVPKYKNAIVHFACVRKTSDDLGIKDLIGHDELTTRVRALDKDSIFRQNIMPLITGVKKHGDDRVHSLFLRDFDRDYGIQLFENVGTPYYDNGAFNCYPMLTFVGTISIRSYSRTNLSVLFDYIKMIDTGAKS